MCMYSRINPKFATPYIFKMSLECSQVYCHIHSVFLMASSDHEEFSLRPFGFVLSLMGFIMILSVAFQRATLHRQNVLILKQLAHT